MKLISLGECDKHLIYPLFGGISKLIVNLIFYLFTDNVEINNHPFILGINAGLGMSLTIIPYLFKLKLDKKSKRKKEFNASKKLDEIDKNNNPMKKRNKYLIIFICSFLDFLQKDLVFLFSYSINNNIWMFNILFLNIFTSIIIKNQIYKHQYLSLGIMILLGILLNIFDLKEMKLNDLSILFLSIIIEIIYSLEIVLAKYGMDNNSCSPFEITFYEGFFSLILNIIFLIIATNIPLDKNFKYNNLLKISEYKGEKYLDNFYSYIENLNVIEILLFITTMIGRLFFNLFSKFTLNYFTSSHVVLILIMGEITIIFIDRSFIEIIFIIIILLFEFFMLLIFCEIIELNCCGLDENTKKNILLREGKVINENDDEDKEEEKENKDRHMNEIFEDPELYYEEQISVNTSF